METGFIRSDSPLNSLSVEPPPTPTTSPPSMASRTAVLYARASTPPLAGTSGIADASTAAAPAPGGGTGGSVISMQPRRGGVERFMNSIWVGSFAAA